jgi:hypothetical protein
MTIVEARSVITGGVDTHSEVHVAAALDPIGGLLGVREFPATAAGYAGLLEWLQELGDIALVGVEGTGSYGAGLARHLAGAGVQVVEVDRADRQDRRRKGKSDPLDAVSAARAAQSGRPAGMPKGRDGAAEALRALMVAKRSARNERTQAINQARALILTGPMTCGNGSPDMPRPRWPRRSPRCGPGPAMPPSTRSASRCANSAGGWISSTARSSVWTSSSSRSSPPRLPACSAFTVLARTPRRCSWSPPATVPSASAAKPRGPICAASPRSRPLPARYAAIGSTPAETARPTTPCGGS